MIEKFLDENKLPILKKLDSSYIKKLQKEKKITIIAAVDALQNDHRLYLSTIFTKYALVNRQFVFTYIDKAEDAFLFNYFKIGADLPQIVIYDFENRYYYSNPEIKDIDILLNKIRTGSLEWSTGNWFEDILAKFGIRVTQTGVMWTLGISFILIVGFLIVIMFICGDKYDDEERKEQIEAETKKTN